MEKKFRFIFRKKLLFQFKFPNFISHIFFHILYRKKAKFLRRRAFSNDEWYPVGQLSPPRGRSMAEERSLEWRWASWALRALRSFSIFPLNLLRTSNTTFSVAAADNCSSNSNVTTVAARKIGDKDHCLRLRSILPSALCKR